MGRWELLKKHRFSPSKHLKWNQGAGLYFWDDDCPLELLTEIMEYFGKRQEDSSDSDSDSSSSDSSHHSSHHGEEGADGFGDDGGGGFEGDADGFDGEYNDEGNDIESAVDDIGNAMDFYG